jgi:hypothetical protein
MVIWGTKANGRTGVMSADDLQTFVTTNAGMGTPAWRANVRGTHGDMIGGGGNGSHLTHRGKTIYHITRGAGPNHVTIFFTKQGGTVISVIGVGSHRHAGGHDYDLDWHTPGWKTGNVVQL